MPRRSLRPELNRIRAWVRQGRTDAWIAHQLEVTVQQIQAFKREQSLEPDADPDTPAAATDFDDEIDLRAEDDALIAANNEIKQIEAFVEADSLAYLSLDGLRESVRDRDQSFCYACYTGHYPTLVQIDEIVMAKTGCC
jgi:hypothetical protein